jgi:anti-sigma factor RsiW
MGIVLDSTKCFLPHPNEEILDEYVLGRLPEALAAQVEEHLLICHRCQDAITATDQLVSALKAAPRETTSAGERAGYTRTSLVPILALVVLAAVIVWKRPREASLPVAVSLSSLHGPNPLSSAPAGKPLLLSIDSPGLSQEKEYRVEVVDAAGSPVWRGAVARANGKLLGQMPTPLGNGIYWVRLYDTGSRLLREFGLSAK